MGGAPVRIALAPSQTAAALLALGRPGLTSCRTRTSPPRLHHCKSALLGELESLRQPLSTVDRLSRAESSGRPSTVTSPVRDRAQRGTLPPNVAEMEDVLPYFQSCLERTSDAAAAPHAHCGGGSWTHPRDTHGAALTKRARRVVPVTKDTEHPHTAAVRCHLNALDSARTAADDVQRLLDVLRRWGIKTLGALAALPAGDVYERLGERGALWQRWRAATISGRWCRGCRTIRSKPRSSSNGRSKGSSRCRSCSRGCSSRWPSASSAPIAAPRSCTPPATDHARRPRRTLQLPAPMRDPKTLRTLVLLDLESHPPSPRSIVCACSSSRRRRRCCSGRCSSARKPSPEQVSTLLARLTALMGEGHVGSPQLVDTWKPGAFEMTDFGRDTGAPCGTLCSSAPHRTRRHHVDLVHPTHLRTALRRFRFPIPPACTCRKADRCA